MPDGREEGRQFIATLVAAPHCQRIDDNIESWSNDKYIQRYQLHSFLVLDPTHLIPVTCMYMYITKVIEWKWTFSVWYILVTSIPIYQHLKLTGTVFSSCILYLRRVPGFPVRSRKMKKVLPVKNITRGTREDPKEWIQLGIRFIDSSNTLVLIIFMEDNIIL